MLTEHWYTESSPRLEEKTTGEWGLWSSYAKKGELGGQCQRFACVNPDAYWLHQRDARYYCSTCAEAFNAAALRSGQALTCVRY